MPKGAIRIHTGDTVLTPMGEGIVIGLTQEKTGLRGRPTNFAQVGGLPTAKGGVRAKPVAFRLSELKF